MEEPKVYSTGEIAFCFICVKCQVTVDIRCIPAVTKVLGDKGPDFGESQQIRSDHSLQKPKRKSNK